MNYAQVNQTDQNILCSHPILNNCIKQPTLEQVRYVINDASILTLVMADQTIIQAAISSIETFDGNKNKFEVCIVSCAKCSTNFWSRHSTNSIFKNARATINLSS